MTISDGRGAGREYLFEAEATLGRTDENLLVIVDPGISRRHARVAGAHGVYVLEDLGSANGTRLNGELLLGPEVLRDGDLISLGDTSLVFSCLDTASAARTAKIVITGLDHDRLADGDLARGRAGGGPGARRCLLAGAGLLLLLAAATGVVIMRRSGGPAGDDRSGIPVDYSDSDEFFNRVFGFGKYDQSHRHQVAIAFEYLGGRATLGYGAAWIDKVGEVLVTVNGEKVGEVPLTMGKWVYGMRVDLPRDKLRKNQKNVIAFVSTQNPPAADEWEICYVQITQEAIPPPDAAKARLEFELGRKSYEDRDLDPGNLADALERFRKVRDYLELLPDKPESYREALDYIEKADAELTQRFQDGLFSARRAEKVEYKPEEAKQILRRTLRHFRKDDFRRREIKQQIDRLERGR